MMQQQDLVFPTLSPWVLRGSSLPMRRDITVEPICSELSR